VVFLEKSRDEQQYMKIYDLESVKYPKRTQDELLVHTLVLKFHFDGIALTETEIFSQGGATIRILDFNSFNVFRNEAKSVNLSLPWRGVWRSKGVDEEPLKSVHHMEVYRQVLKYFEELIMNCHTTIKRYPVAGPDTASSTLRNLFVSYEQRLSEGNSKLIKN
jgi:hypothetical protein